jgi:threonine dehydrogenase-like Zn-dependent dehydrogenase
MNNNSKTQFNKVLVIGLGQLGLPVAKYVKEKGFDDVYGYDISPKTIDRAEKTAGIKLLILVILMFILFVCLRINLKIYSHRA